MCVWKPGISRDMEELDSTQLSTELRQKCEKRCEVWQKFFIKCEKVTTYSVEAYSMADVPEPSYDETTMNYSNKVSEINLSESEKALVAKIENELCSNLNKIILQREKTKIMDDLERYIVLNAQLKDEIRRLRKLATVQEIKSYIYLCVTRNKDIEHLIEDILQCDLQSTLRQKMKAMDKPKNDFLDFKLMAEWGYLTRTLPEEDVVIYAVNVLTKRASEN